MFVDFVFIIICTQVYFNTYLSIIKTLKTYLITQSLLKVKIYLDNIPGHLFISGFHDVFQILFLPEYVELYTRSYLHGTE